MGNQRVKYLHTMVRVADLEASLAFYCDSLGLKEVSKVENPAGRFTLVFTVRRATNRPPARIVHRRWN